MFYFNERNPNMKDNKDKVSQDILTGLVLLSRIRDAITTESLTPTESLIQIFNQEKQKHSQNSTASYKTNVQMLAKKLGNNNSNQLTLAMSHLRGLRIFYKGSKNESEVNKALFNFLDAVVTILKTRISSEQDLRNLKFPELPTLLANKVDIVNSSVVNVNNQEHPAHPVQQPQQIQATETAQNMQPSQPQVAPQEVTVVERTLSRKNLPKNKIIGEYINIVEENVSSEPQDAQQIAVPKIQEQQATVNETQNLQNPLSALNISVDKKPVTPVSFANDLEMEESNNLEMEYTNSLGMEYAYSFQEYYLQTYHDSIDIETAYNKMHQLIRKVGADQVRQTLETFTHSQETTMNVLQNQSANKPTISFNRDLMASHLQALRTSQGIPYFKEDAYDEIAMIERHEGSAGINALHHQLVEFYEQFAQQQSQDIGPSPTPTRYGDVVNMGRRHSMLSQAQKDFVAQRSQHYLYNNRKQKGIEQEQQPKIKQPIFTDINQKFPDLSNDDLNETRPQFKI